MRFEDSYCSAPPLEQFLFFIWLMHSVTKFIGGHSDVVMGSISCNDKVGRWMSNGPSKACCTTSYWGRVFLQQSILLEQIKKKFNDFLFFTNFIFFHRSLSLNITPHILLLPNSYFSHHWLIQYFPILSYLSRYLGNYRQVALCSKRIWRCSFSFRLLLGQY